MGFTLTDVLLFGGAKEIDADNAAFVIMRRNILRWGAIGGYVSIIVHGVPPLVLPDAIEGGLVSLKAFGGTVQGVPVGYTQMASVANLANTVLDTGLLPTIDDVELEFRIKPSTGSWYIFQSRPSGGSILGISGAASGDKIQLNAYGNTIVSDISRNNSHIYYVKATMKNGAATLYVKDETANTEDTQTGTYTFAAPTSNYYLWGNEKGDMVAANNWIYYARMKIGGENVMDYVPCMDSNNILGFYDKITGTFKTKTSTTGGLTADTVVNPTPDAPMDIICNNGALKIGANMVSMIEDNLAVGYYINNSGVVSGDVNNFYYKTPILVQPNTTYKMVATLSLGYFSVMEYSDTDCTQFIKRTLFGTPGTNAGYATEFTTDANTQAILFGANIDFAAVTLAKIQAINWYLTDTKIYTDGTTETIQVYTKNMLDMADANIQVGKYINNSGVVTSNNFNFYNSKFIEVEPNTTYTLSMSTAVAYASIMEYDATQTFIARDLFGDGSLTLAQQTFTTGATTKYILLGSNIKGGVITIDDVKAINWQIEKGSTATDYVQYFVGTPATAEMLLKIDGYVDEHEIISGTVTRKILIKVLDGSETWGSGSNGTFSASGWAEPFLRTSTSPACICTHYKGIKANLGIAYMSDKSIKAGYTSGSAGTRDLLYLKDSALTTIAQVKNFLSSQYTAGTPVIVIGVATTATTETVTGQPMQTVQGDNIVEITQASLTGLELEAQYNAAVSLTIQEVQDANLDPNVEVTIN